MDRLRFLGRTPGTTVVSGYPGCELGPYYEFDRWNPIPLITVQGVEREEVEYGLDDLKLRRCTDPARIGLIRVATRTRASSPSN